MTDGVATPRPAALVLVAEMLRWTASGAGVHAEPQHGDGGWKADQLHAVYTNEQNDRRCTAHAYIYHVTVGLALETLCVCTIVHNVQWFP